MIGLTKGVFIAAGLSLFALSAIASEAEFKELIKKSKEFMDDYYRDVITDMKFLNRGVRNYTAEEAKIVSTIVAVDNFVKRTAVSTELTKLIEKLEKSGELKNFKIQDQVSPELVAELEDAVRNLITEKDSIAPRFVGAFIMGSTQLVTDVVRMGLTRY